MGKKRVFIIGAGASVGFNFPPGIDLLEKIYKKWENPNKELIDLFTHIWSYLGVEHEGPTPEKSIQRYAQKLYFSGAISIDDFLSKSKEQLLREFGRATILTEILDNENKTLVKNENELFKFKDNWLRELFGRFFRFPELDDLKRFLKHNTFEFIIFNYDRCIEFFLFAAIQNYYSITKEDAHKIINEIKFEHVYGKPGKMSWEEGYDVKNDVAFGQELRTDEKLKYYKKLQTITPNIKVIGEDNIPRSYIEIINSADIVYILGYGFHSENNRLLQFTHLNHLINQNSRTRFFITSFGLSQHVKNYIQTNFNTAIVDEAKIYDFMHHHDIELCADDTDTQIKITNE
ncbi:MAG: hypothetical protein KBD53_11470 [Candidatus Omnitrophica bacterium]|nr:hypothetical protein [Candidatus Omnitrophota bacterium]